MFYNKLQLVVFMAGINLGQQVVPFFVCGSLVAVCSVTLSLITMLEETHLELFCQSLP